MSSIARVQEARAPLLIEPPRVADLIKKIALTCLKELALSLALGLTVACFITTSGGFSLMITAVIVQLTVSLLFHSLGAFASYKVTQKGPNQKPFEWLLWSCEYVTGFNFAVFTGYNTQSLIHETGHALALLSLYKKPHPQIELYPFGGGNTQFYKSSPTPFGRKVGPVATTCIIFASGPAFTLLISSALFAIGFAIIKKYPHLGKYLIAWGIVDFCHNACYAYSALHTNPWNPGHDFVHLAILGLHPVTATIGILAIPILIILGMQCCKSRQPQKQQLALVLT